MDKYMHIEGKTKIENCQQTSIRSLESNGGLPPDQVQNEGKEVLYMSLDFNVWF